MTYNNASHADNANLLQVTCKLSYRGMFKRLLLRMDMLLHRHIDAEKVKRQMHDQSMFLASYMLQLLQ